VARSELGEIFLGQCAGLAAAAEQGRFDAFLHHEVAAVGVAQEHHARSYFLRLPDCGKFSHNFFPSEKRVGAIEFNFWNSLANYPEDGNEYCGHSAEAMAKLPILLYHARPAGVNGLTRFRVYTDPFLLPEREGVVDNAGIWFVLRGKAGSSARRDSARRISDG
jgi:hypothetical protein